MKIRGSSGGLAAATLVYAAATVALYPSLFIFNLLNFTFDLLPAGFALSVVGLTTVAIAKRRSAPLSFILDVIRRRGIGIIITSVVLCIGLAAFWTLKYHYPSYVPFYADPFFANADRVLHSGDPWRWTHAILPSSMIEVMVIMYFPAWLIQYFACISLAVFLLDEHLRARYFLNFLLIYFVLGTFGATAASSVGPIYYDHFFGGDRFAELLNAMRSSEASAPVLSIADRLLSAHETGVEDYFAGISAMPSIHVAIVTLNAFFLGSLNKSLGVAAWIFVVLTLFGSVFFGWHYAIDGYIAIVAVTLFWRATSSSAV